MDSARVQGSPKGFKPRPKSDADIRPIPLGPLVVEAIRRQLPPGNDPQDLVFTRPGRRPRPRRDGMPRGARTVLSRHNFHRTYHAALAKLTDPTGEPRPTAGRALKALEGAARRPLTSSPSRSPSRAEPFGQPPSRSPSPSSSPPTSSAVPARTVSSVGERCPRSGTRCWRPWIYGGAHDFRHTFATWLEDAGIPARVIDELMGHEATGRSRQHQAAPWAPTTGTPPARWPGA
jgi:hypothetical protein